MIENIYKHNSSMRKDNEETGIEIRVLDIGII